MYSDSLHTCLICSLKHCRLLYWILCCLCLSLLPLLRWLPDSFWIYVSLVVCKFTIHFLRETLSDCRIGDFLWSMFSSGNIDHRVSSFCQVWFPFSLSSSVWVLSLSLLLLKWSPVLRHRGNNLIYTLQLWHTSHVHYPSVTISLVNSNDVTLG